MVKRAVGTVHAHAHRYREIVIQQESEADGGKSNARWNVHCSIFTVAINISLYLSIARSLSPAFHLSLARASDHWFRCCFVLDFVCSK